MPRDNQRSADNPVPEPGADRNLTFESVSADQRITPIDLAREWDVSPSCITRWVDDGVKVNGQRERLRGTRIGRRIFFLKADVADFLTRTNRCSSPAPTERPASDRRDKANKQAEAMGL